MEACYCECVSNYECSQHHSMCIFIWHVAIKTCWLTDWCHFMLAEDWVKNMKWNETGVAGTIKKGKSTVNRRKTWIYPCRTYRTYSMIQENNESTLGSHHSGPSSFFLFLFFIPPPPPHPPLPPPTSSSFFLFSSSFFRPRYPTCRTKEDSSARKRGRTYISMFACCTVQLFCC